MTTTGLSKDARGFVDSVVTYLKSDGKSHSSVPRVERMIDRVTKNAKRESSAVITSAVPFTDDEKVRLSKEISMLVGHELIIEYEVRKELIAGFCIRLGDVIIDTSFRRKLTEMASQCVAP
jgi:F0F1-type ATP synthase delta subunit